MRASIALSLLVVLLVAPACKREDRRVREIPPATTPKAVIESDLHPGKASATSGTVTPYAESAYQVSEGQRLFDWYNCSGCHAHGGGGMGPALMDDKWIYGSDPSNIFETIVEGRPNGMPSFRGKIPDYQVWQLVAYVRSLSGLLQKDVAPGRDDHMSTEETGVMAPTQKPKKTGSSK